MPRIAWYGLQASQIPVAYLVGHRSLAHQSCPLCICMCFLFTTMTGLVRVQVVDSMCPSGTIMQIYTICAMQCTCREAICALRALVFSKNQTPLYCQSYTGENCILRLFFGKQRGIELNSMPRCLPENSLDIQFSPVAIALTVTE